MYPNILLRIAKFLRNYENLPLEGDTGDGRVDSRVIEGKIIKILEENFNIKPAKKRAWYDFKVGAYFVDIKISELKGAADNTNAKGAIYYVLTGKNPEKVSDKEDKFFSSLKENIKENDKDYYYLVVGKNAPPKSPERAFITSLRTLPDVRPNRNNMPFQCVWKTCINNSVDRSHREVKDFLLGKWGESISLDIKALESGMPVFFPEYFKK